MNMNLSNVKTPFSFYVESFRLVFNEKKTKFLGLKLELKSIKNKIKTLVIKPL